MPFPDAAGTWFAVSLQTFGGPAGQIAVMQRTLIEEKRWIGQRRFLHALSYCTLLPGPEAQQLAIYIGWLLNGVRDGLVAGTLFVLPGVVALLALSVLYVAAGTTTLVAAVFAGLAPAVLAIVAQAVVRVGRRALGHPALVALAVAAFLALSVFRMPFPVVIAGAAAAGGRWDGGRRHDPHGQVTPGPRARPRRSSRTTPCTPSAATPRTPSRCARCARLGPSSRRCRGAHRHPQRVHRAEPVLLRVPPWSPSAVPMPCSPTSPNRRSRCTAGSRRGRWCAASRWPRRPPAH